MPRSKRKSVRFGEVVEARRRYFAEPYPADTIVEIKGLYTPEAMIEIEAVALRSAARAFGR